MEAEWSVAAAEGDPVVVVPWSDEDGESVYIDLRAHPERIERILEADTWPELREALLLLNAPSAGTWTAKCDAWELSDEEKSLDFGEVACGIGCYIDIFRMQERIFASLDQQISTIKRMAAAAEALTPHAARTEFILRPAEWSHAAGFATTVYVYGYGASFEEARQHWREALANVVQLVLRETLE